MGAAEAELAQLQGDKGMMYAKSKTSVKDEYIATLKVKSVF